MLDGIRIIEFEALGPAPFAGMLLADLGAEVIVVNRPAAAQTPVQPGQTLLDRGKRSITLDLKSSDDLAIVHALLKSAQGLTEGLRPGVMERLGLGPEEVHALNPGLVYGRMTGWGQDGPLARQAGHDLNYLARSGALFYAGLPEQPPAVPPTMLGDIGAGALYLTVGMLAALMRAARTGQGAVVDAAIVDGASHMMALLLSMGPRFSMTARGASLLDGPHWTRCYACSCGGHVAVQCLEPKFYAEFLSLLGLEADPKFVDQYDPEQWAAQTARLVDIFAAQTRDHWAQVFEGSDACVAPVLSPAEAQYDPQIAARGIWVGDAPRAAPRFDGAIPAVPPSPPGRDADGLDLIAELREKGVL